MEQKNILRLSGEERRGVLTLSGGEPRALHPAGPHGLRRRVQRGRRRHRRQEDGLGSLEAPGPLRAFDSD